MPTVTSEIAATVWKLTCNVGDDVVAGSEIAILESMKMEIPVIAEVDGVLTEYLVSVGDVVDEGQELALIRSFDHGQH